MNRLSPKVNHINMNVLLVVATCLLAVSAEETSPEVRSADEEFEMRTAMENEDLFEGDILQDSLLFNAMPHKWRFEFGISFF